MINWNDYSIIMYIDFAVFAVCKIRHFLIKSAICYEKYTQKTIIKCLEYFDVCVLYMCVCTRITFLCLYNITHTKLNLLLHNNNDVCWILWDKDSFEDFWAWIKCQYSNFIYFLAHLWQSSQIDYSCFFLLLFTHWQSTVVCRSTGEDWWFN